MAPAGGGSFGGASTGGSAGGPSAMGGSGGASPYANFATVREVVALVCGTASCHLGEAKPTLANDASLFSVLTTYVSKGCENNVLVKPGAPDQSAFWLVQRGPCGTVPRMPKGCTPGENCIPQEYVDGIQQWIANGAPQN
jgi:hypothetical protein